MSNKLTMKIPNFPGKEIITRTTSRALLKIQKHSPEICVGTGIVLGVGATIFACKATLRVNEVIDSYKETMNNINFLKTEAEAGRPKDGYSVEEAQKEKFIATVQMLAKLGKLYSPAIAMGVASIGFIIGGHHILARRNAALSLTLTAVQKAYDEYRARVREVIGEEKEMDIFHGVKEVTVEEKDESGETKTVKKEKIIPVGSPYTRIFDESNPWWTNSAEHNKFFLSRIQAHANDILRTKGHLFFNDVLEMLGFEPTPCGALCGWIYGEGDSFVDFGIWDFTKERTRAFINGYEKCIWLNFNCDGVIYDRI